MKAGSLFSGIGGFDLACEVAGISCRWQVENDPFCNRVLERHWPNVKRYGDVRGLRGNELEPVDLICGGFPCQDLSVAGQRKGLAGERSGLWFEFHRILAEHRPRFAIIENVPGLLSSAGGSDFAIILRGLVELGYGVAWRMLDAQYFGVAQRRRRLFIVGSLGSGCATTILFESEGGGWHPAPSHQAGARTAASLTSGSGVTGNTPGRRREDDMNLIAFDTCNLTSAENRTRCEPGDPCPTLHGQGTMHVAPALTARQGKGGFGDPVNDGIIAYQQQGTNVGEMGALRRGNGHVTGGVPFIAFSNRGVDGASAETLRAGSHGALPMVAHTLRSEGADASEDGTGRGVPVVMAFQTAGYGSQVSDIVPTLQASFDRLSNQITGIIEPTMVIRRLTPTECLRLQGFPDDWLSGLNLSDSAKYRMCGNAVAVPVVVWLLKRLLVLAALPGEQTEVK